MNTVWEFGERPEGREEEEGKKMQEAMAESDLQHESLYDPVTIIPELWGQNGEMQ